MEVIFMANLIKKEFIMGKKEIAGSYLSIIKRAKKLLLKSAKGELGLDRQNLVITDFFEKDIVDNYVMDNTFICITSLIIPSNKFKKIKIKSHDKEIELNLSGLEGEYYLTNQLLLEQNTMFEYEAEPQGNIELRGFKIQKKGLTTLEDKEHELSILK